MDEELFWINNPKIIIDKYNQIIPNREMSINTFYNTITRLLMYLIIIIYFIFKSVKIIIILILIIIYIIMLNNKTTDKQEIPTTTICRDSTINNPMANPYVIGSKLDVKACKDLNSLKVLDNLRFNIYEDSNRPINRKILERSYYTLPVTHYPNDIDNFINELYKNTHKTCKIDSENCETYRDLRFIR